MRPCFESYETKIEKENARLRAELEAAKWDIQKILQDAPDENMCVYCAHIDDPCCTCCDDAEWRGLCAANAGEGDGADV
jgi:hypothetical protein